MFVCYLCDSTSICRKDLMQHLRWTHYVNTNIPCFLCNGYLFKRSKHYQDHLRDKHPNGNVFGPFFPPNFLHVEPPLPEPPIPEPEPERNEEMDADFAQLFENPFEGEEFNPDEEVAIEPDAIFDAKFESFLQSCFYKWLEFINHPDATIKSAIIVCNTIMDTTTSAIRLLDPYLHTSYLIESSIKHKFLPFSTEYRRRKFLIERNLYAKPEEYLTNIEQYVAGTPRGNVNRERRNLVAVIPLEKTLLKVLSNESLANSLVMPSDFSNSETFCHPFAARRAQNLLNRLGEDCLLIELYMDEFVTSCPIGNTSAVYKMAAWYIRLLNLPLDMLSMLDHIMLVSLAHAVDVMNDLQEILRITLLPQFKKLEADGITFQYRGEERTFKVILYRLAADNLGFHQFVGLTRCFSGNNPCWMCTETAESLRTVCSLNPQKLRSREQYDRLVTSAPIQQRQQYGISVPCCLNELQHFHCMENFSVDYMHDLHEGHFLRLLPRVFRDAMAAGFSLETLNNAIAAFGPVGDDGSNPLRPIYLPTVEPENGDTLGGYTAKTSGVLIRFLPLIFKFGQIQLRTPSWRVLMMLQRILDILMAPEITAAHINMFDTLVQNYLKAYIEMGGKMTVKPHKLLHYKAVMEEMGPLRHLATFRYEGKHSHLKQYSNVNRCFKNLQTTLADKNELMFAYVLLNMKAPDYLESRRKNRSLSKFKKHLAVIYGQNPETREPMFGQIYNYDVNDDRLSLKLLILEEFDEPTHCYVVKETENVIEIFSNSLVCPEPMSIYRRRKNYIRLPYFLP